MKRLSDKDLSQLFANAQVLGEHKRGPKILLTPEGDILKVFYRRGGLSSDKLFPYAKRFIRHSQQLHRSGIETVDITDSYYCPHNKAYILRYPKLPGDDVRSLVKQQPELLADVARFVAKLHEKGIFFRAIHLGNLLYHEGKFALLDITDLSIQRRPLSHWRRVRNLKHLLFYRGDKEYFKAFGIKRFLEIYFEKTSLDTKQRSKLVDAITP
ncbi:MAG: toluene tolerance protein [Legionellales bacterium]|nr:toluene tolerance protein [Legionellales bacterium]|tara:strand:+ start:5427 stop:6062 length:636 start_codon:yes stop_codon:yes gene_type:complete